ncbi:hypothetical protein CGCF413_v015575 [Colletotrichum fructicola]|nr:hypothetical protein CFRS1_v009678 [Colletotrichum fructicola]KAF5482738.1 hypothetical protein CGCF413_v015575 [Colletotrichum fructicola]
MNPFAGSIDQSYAPVILTSYNETPASALWYDFPDAPTNVIGVVNYHQPLLIRFYSVVKPEIYRQYNRAFKDRLSNRAMVLRKLKLELYRAPSKTMSHGLLIFCIKPENGTKPIFVFFRVA